MPHLSWWPCHPGDIYKTVQQEEQHIMKALMTPRMGHFLGGLAGAAVLVLGTALVQWSASPITDWHLVLRTFVAGEAGAIGSYLVHYFGP